MTGAKALHLGHLAEEIAGQVEDVYAVIHQRAAAHHLDVMDPGLCELAAAGVSRIAANVVQVADATGIENAPSGDDRGIEAVIESGGEVPLGGAGRRENLPAFLRVPRERFFAQDVLAAAERLNAHFRMKRRRRRDDHRVHIIAKRCAPVALERHTVALGEGAPARNVHVAYDCEADAGRLAERLSAQAANFAATDQSKSNLSAHTASHRPTKTT